MDVREYQGTASVFVMCKCGQMWQKLENFKEKNGRTWVIDLELCANLNVFGLTLKCDCSKVIGHVIGLEVFVIRNAIRLKYRTPKNTDEIPEPSDWN